jgi:hypothetical protein
MAVVPWCEYDEVGGYDIIGDSRLRYISDGSARQSGLLGELLDRCPQWRLVESLAEVTT